jgi:hypothetical protein
LEIHTATCSDRNLSDICYATSKNGFTWGISHFTNVTSWETNHTVLARFDCDLSLDIHDPDMKKSHMYLKPEFFYKMGLTKKQQERIQQANDSLLKKKD